MMFWFGYDKSDVVSICRKNKEILTACLFILFADYLDSAADGHPSVKMLLRL